MRGLDLAGDKACRNERVCLTSGFDVYRQMPAQVIKINAAWQHNFGSPRSTFMGRRAWQFALRSWLDRPRAGNLLLWMICHWHNPESYRRHKLRNGAGGSILSERPMPAFAQRWNGGPFSHASHDPRAGGTEGKAATLGTVEPSFRFR